MRVSTFAGLVGLGTLAVSACLDDSITGTRPLTLELSVEPETVLVNQLVTARYDATGSGMYGIIVDWGDGAIDSLSLSGSVVTISGPVEHQYANVGQYIVTGTVEAQNGVLSATASVQVN